MTSKHMSAQEYIAENSICGRLSADSAYAESPELYRDIVAILGQPEQGAGQSEMSYWTVAVAS